MFTSTWECKPEILQLDLDVIEFCHFLKGHWVLTSEFGQVNEIMGGDSWVFRKAVRAPLR